MSRGRCPRSSEGEELYMTKYEKHVLAFAMAAFGGILYFCCIIGVGFADFLSLLMWPCFFVMMLVIRIFPFDYKDWPSMSDTERMLSYKSTAWTAYVAIVVILLLVAIFVPKEILVERNALGLAMIVTLLSMIMLRHVILFGFLRYSKKHQEFLMVSQYTLLPDR